MKKPYLSKAMTFLSLMLMVLVANAWANDATTPTERGTSKVRIVRLSQVSGSVEIARASDRNFEPAVANLPIIEKNQLRTGVGVAEVEFEDNSSMRLAPNTVVEFVDLGRNGSGATQSSVHVIKGTVFLSLVKPQSSNSPMNDFTLIFGNRKIALDAATHLRLDMDGSEAKLAVLDGAVRVNGDDGMLNIEKKRTANFSLVAEDEPTIAKDVEKTPFDAWDHTATSYHSGVAAMSAYSSPYAYGTNDMAYYGNFVDAGNCGMMWRPYFASAGWDPFASGSWAYYQGAGYSWVSPYPWAWTPYHSGAWSYCPDRGWGWMPSGGQWYGLNNTTALIAKQTSGGNGGFPRLPPPHPPKPHEPSVIAVNTRAQIESKIASPTSFEFRKDSAGLGVPRGTLGHLQKFSNQTESHGVARTAVYVDVPAAGGRADGRITMSQTMGASIHRGYAPSSTYSSSSSYSGVSSGVSSSSSSSVSSGRSSVGSSPSAPSAPSGGGVRK